VQQLANLREGIEQFDGFANFHIEHISDTLVAKPDFQGFAAETSAFANGTGDPDIGEEVHFQFGRTVAFAGFTASAFDIETEATFLVSAQFGLRQLCVEFADFVEDFDVGGGVGPGCAADGRLIDIDGFVDLIQPFNPVMQPGFSDAAIDFPVDNLPEDIVDQ